MSVLEYFLAHIRLGEGPSDAESLLRPFGPLPCDSPAVPNTPLPFNAEKSHSLVAAPCLPRHLIRLPLFFFGPSICPIVPCAPAVVLMARRRLCTRSHSQHSMAPGASLHLTMYELANRPVWHVTSSHFRSQQTVNTRWDSPQFIIWGIMDPCTHNC